MDAQQIFKLLDAGFSADEIRSMMTPASPETQPETEPEAVAQTLEEPTHKEQSPADQTAQIEELKRQVANLQAENLRRAQDPNPPKKLNASDVIKQFLETP